MYVVCYCKLYLTHFQQIKSLPVNQLFFHVFRCILSFEVFYSCKSAHGPFKRVNEVDIIFTSYHHTLSEGKLVGHVVGL